MELTTDDDSASKRRRYQQNWIRYFAEWFPASISVKGNRHLASPTRTLLQKCIYIARHPCTLTLLVICLFFGSTMNRGARIVEVMHHCTRQWNSDDLSYLPSYSDKPAIVDDKITLMLNSFHRPDLMRKSLKHYAQCHSILHQIRVIWCEEDYPPAMSSKTGRTPIIYDVMKGTSLNNRFRPIENLETEAVMSIDDDIYMPCFALKKAFRVWKDNKRSLVGFFPRTLLLNENCKYEYDLGTKTYADGMYSMILTKAAVFHRDYLTAYFTAMPSSVRDYVDSKHNCEDIAMQLLIANYTSNAAKFVNSPWLRDCGTGLFKVKGISSAANHKMVRAQCLNDLVAMFNHVPLTSKPLNADGESLLWIRFSKFISSLLNLF